MDPISTKIVNAKTLREEAEARAAREAQERLRKLQENPEYRRRLRYLDTIETMFGLFRARCLGIQAETEGVESDYALHFEPLDLSPAAKQELRGHSVLPNENWSVRVGETRLSIQIDPSGSDTLVDFFGTLTVLGQSIYRKMFFVSPGPTFWELLDPACPSDFYTLQAMRKSGAKEFKTDFPQLLEDGLQALTDVAFADKRPSGDWIPVEGSMGMLAALEAAEGDRAHRPGSGASCYYCREGAWSARGRPGRLGYQA